MRKRYSDEYWFYVDLVKAVNVFMASLIVVGLLLLVMFPE